jgi:hypothetical protein
MTSSGKNQKNNPKKSKRQHKQALSEKGMAVVLSQKEVTFFDKWNNSTRANLLDNDIKLIDDPFKMIDPWLHKLNYFKLQKSFRVNLAMIDSIDPLGEDLQLTMKCKRQLIVAKSIKLLFLQAYDVFQNR